MNSSWETADLVYQNILIKELDFDESGFSNEEENQETDYAVVNDSDALVDKSPQKRA